MPIPYPYRHASAEFRGFLNDPRDEMNLESDRMAHTAAQGVFLTFRGRPTVRQGLAFADDLTSGSQDLWQVDGAVTGYRFR